MLSVPEDIYDNAYAYLLIIFLGMPFTLLYNYLSSILRSVGDSRTPFMFLALSAILNIFLDLFLHCGIEMGLCGRRHCYDHSAGNQRNFVSCFYCEENEPSLAV